MLAVACRPVVQETGFTMLKWLATKFENQRATLQSKLEHSLRSRPDILAPVNSEEWRKRGNACLRDDRLEAAAQCYRNGIQADAADAICYSNLGYVLVQLGRWAEAEEMLGKAVERNPEDFDAYYLLGNLARDRNELPPAIASYRAALTINPAFDVCRRDLCIALAQSGQPKEAQVTMSQGPAFGTDSVNFHFFSGNLHQASGNSAAAVASFLLAKQLKPDESSILINLSNAQIRLGDVFAALRNSQRLIRLEPDNAQAYAALAVAYLRCGQWEDSISSYRHAMQLNPQYLAAQQNLLNGLTYFPNCTAADYLEEAQSFGQKVSARAKPYTQWYCPQHGIDTRPLRVGFVSGDLKAHPVGMFLASILPAIDPSKVTCVAYSNAVAEDSLTEYLKTYFPEWNQVSSMQDRDLAAKIHSDCIDILVDLAGHTDATRLQVFAWRPAPVQVAWLGYWASTGVAEMDYILVDRVSVHEEEAQYYSEKLWYLPETRLCLSPPCPPSESDLPALRKGYVTFGSYQASNKISDGVLALWSQVMAQVPTARLRLQGVPLKYEESVSDIKRRLEEACIDLDRVDMVDRVMRWEYLQSYKEVDVVLDTFPYPGGTTTAEALWMGVPTVTLTGSTLLARQGESMLRCTGLEDWVAHSEPEYVQIAVDKASDLHGLASLRARVFRSIATSPLFDGVRFARNLELAFDGMAKARMPELTDVLH